MNYHVKGMSFGCYRQISRNFLKIS